MKKKEYFCLLNIFLKTLNFMPIIRVTKVFYFEASHALLNYDGLCRNVHGHSYKLFVTVKGRTEVSERSSKLGMVIDFSVLKEIVKNNITDIYDHSFLVNKSENIQNLLSGSPVFNRTHFLDFQPTCENLVYMFSKIIKSKLPQGIELYSLRLYETENSFAEWFAEDQE